MAGADWSSLNQINIIFSPSPPARLSFTIPLLLVDKATNTLGGSRIVTFGSAIEVAAALVAATISSTTAAWLTAAFSQVPTPARIKVANHDTAGSETLAAALAAIEALDTNWYGTAIYSRANADIAAWALLIEARKKLFIAQSGDSSWLDSGVPAGLSAIAAYERTGVIVHDTATTAADLNWLASRLVFDPDVQSAGWEGQVRGVAALGTGLTTAQRDFVVGNDANVGLPFSSATVYVSPGIVQSGRAIYEIVTADWLAARLSEDFAYAKLAHTAKGEKWIVDGTGQVEGLGLINARLQQGERIGHFVQGQTRATAEPITTQDILDGKLRFKIEAQIARDARQFVVNAYLQPDALKAA